MLNYQEIKAEFEKKKAQNNELSMDSSRKLNKFLSELKTILSIHGEAICVPFRGNIYLQEIQSGIYIKSEAFHKLNLQSQGFKLDCIVTPDYSRHIKISL